MILAVKSTTYVANCTTNDTLSYSFLDLSALVDTYTIAGCDGSKVLSIANNAITVQNDGLHVNISGKADKVNHTAP